MGGSPRGVCGREMIDFGCEQGRMEHDGVAALRGEE